MIFLRTLLVDGRKNNADDCLFARNRNIFAPGIKPFSSFVRISLKKNLRYEQGKILPGYHGLYSIAEKLGISLDWLVCGKGPAYYKEKEKEDQVEEKKETLQDLLTGSSQEEINWTFNCRQSAAPVCFVMYFAGA